MPWIKVRLPESILAMVDAKAEEQFCSRSAAICCLIGHNGSYSTPLVTNVVIDDTNRNRSEPIGTDPDPPSPARARVPNTRQTDRQEDLFGERSEFQQQVDAVAKAIRDNDWYGMKLPAKDTPESYALRLVNAYPDTVTPDMVLDAAMWVYNNPNKRKGKKYLGGFLTNWARRQRDGAQEKKKAEDEEARDPRGAFWYD